MREHAAARGYQVEISHLAPEELPRLHPPGSGTLPDVAVAASLGPARLFWDASLLDVTECAERLIRQNGEVPSLVRGALTFEERLWGVPLYARAWGWLVRQDLLDAAGVASPGTLAEALEVAGKLADPGRSIAGWSLPLTRSSEAEAFVHQVILAYGGALTDAVGRRVVLESPETVEAFEFLADLVRSPAKRATLPPDREAWSGPAREAAFLAGRVAMAPVSAELYLRVKAERRLPPKSLRVIAPPGGPRRRTTAAAGRHLVVSAETKHPDLCLDLVAELASPERLRRLLVESGGAVVPAYANLTSDPFWDGDPFRPAFALSARGDVSRGLELTEYGSPGPSTPSAGEVAAQLVLSGILARCVDDGVPPESAVREGRRLTEEIYERTNRAMAAARRGSP